MKRIALSILLLSTVVLAGCQTLQSVNPFRHKTPAYKSAQQVQPLEVPPGMTAPPTTEALTIPDTGTAASTTTSSANHSVDTTPPSASAPTPQASTASSTLALSDTLASAYHRVGLALARGDVGQVIAHDDAAHTYQVAVATLVQEPEQGGFFHRLFHRRQSETVKGNVAVGVAPATAGSVVSATGDPVLVGKVMAVLKARLK